MSFRKHLPACLLLAGALQGCAAGNQAVPGTPPAADGLAMARAMVGPAWPASTQDRVTTSGDIYLANLDSQIAALARVLEQRPDPRLTARLALNHYHRFQVLGDLADAEKARDLLTAALARGDHAQLRLAQARILLGFHDFDGVRKALDSAARLGVGPARLAPLEAALSRSMPAAADEITAEHVNASSVESLVAAGARAAREGRMAQASRLFRQAQDLYQDSSPYVLAWIHVQQGIAFLDLDDHQTANAFFAAAHARFPQYTLAAEHLAETELALGNAAVAAALYRQVIADSGGHPEFHHQLSYAERALGHEAEAARHEAVAQRAYEELTRRYPLMYADHAIGYYEDTGQRDKARQLAALRSERLDATREQDRPGGRTGG